MAKLKDPFDVLPYHPASRPEVSTEQALQTRLFSYILMGDPRFGPIDHGPRSRSVDGPTNQLIGSVRDAQKLLNERAEGSVTPRKVTALLWEEYNIARQTYASEHPTGTSVEDLPSNPFSEQVVAGIMEHDKAA